MRIPRKLKKKIPKDTFYCYTPTSNIILPEDGSLAYFKIKICPFYKHLEDVDGWCKLIKGEVTDQCKSCGERYGRY